MQNCTTSLGSWLRHGDEVNLNVSVIHSYVASDKIYTKNGKFLVLNNFQTVLTNDGSGNKTMQFEFYTSLQRRSAMQALMMLTPATVFMSLNAIAMWLEPECAERLGLIALNLFMQMAFMQQLAFYVPLNGEHAPLIREC